MTPHPNGQITTTHRRCATSQPSPSPSLRASRCMRSHPATGRRETRQCPRLDPLRRPISPRGSATEAMEERYDAFDASWQRDREIHADPHGGELVGGGSQKATELDHHHFGDAGYAAKLGNAGTHAPTPRSPRGTTESPRRRLNPTPSHSTARSAPRRSGSQRSPPQRKTIATTPERPPRQSASVRWALIRTGSRSTNKNHLPRAEAPGASVGGQIFHK